MESVRDRWTDERLDDLNHRVDLGFRELCEEIRDLRRDLLALRVETTERLDGIHRSMIQLTVGLTTAMVAGFGTIFALLAFRL